MKRLLLLSITLFLLLPLAGRTITAGLGEPVAVSLKGTIDSKELTISVRGEGMDEELNEYDVLMFDFPITDHDKRSWVKEVPLHFTYSSNKNLPSKAHLEFVVGEFVGDSGFKLKPKLEIARSSNKIDQDSDPRRILLETTFESGWQEDTPIVTVIVVFTKAEEELFPVGNYTGVFSINYLGIN